MRKMSGSQSDPTQGGILEFPLPADATPPPGSTKSVKASTWPVKRAEIRVRHAGVQTSPRHAVHDDTGTAGDGTLAAATEFQHPHVATRFDAGNGQGTVSGPPYGAALQERPVLDGSTPLGHIITQQDRDESHHGEEQDMAKVE